MRREIRRDRELGTCVHQKCGVSPHFSCDVVLHKEDSALCPSCKECSVLLSEGKESKASELIYWTPEPTYCAPFSGDLQGVSAEMRVCRHPQPCTICGRSCHNMALSPETAADIIRRRIMNGDRSLDRFTAPTPAPTEASPVHRSDTTLACDLPGCRLSVAAVLVERGRIVLDRDNQDCLTGSSLGTRHHPPHPFRTMGMGLLRGYGLCKMAASLDTGCRSITSRSVAWANRGNALARGGF